MGKQTGTAAVGEPLPKEPDAGAGEALGPDGAERRKTLKGVAKGLAVAGAAAMAGQSAMEVLGHHLPGIEEGHPVNRFVMVIDLAKCTGCEKCTEACRVAHFVPPGQEWIKIYTVDDGFGGQYYLPRPCMMCENPPCRNVCPTGATYKNEYGLTMIDHNRCIGCRYCLAACPYSARYFNWEEPPHTEEELNHEYSPEQPWPHHKGVAEKCMYCMHQRDRGVLPECIGGCPEGALYFGDAAEDGVTNSQGETLPLRKTLAENSAYRLREDLGTGPSVWYLPRRGAP